MFTKFDRHMKLTAIIGMVFVLALSVAWATTNYYSGSVVVQKGTTADKVINLIQGSDKIQVKIQAQTLDDYMEEEGITEVTVTADLTKVWIDNGDGTGYYDLTFELGPSSAYFQPNPLILMVKGEYVSSNTQFWLYDETGEAVSGTRNDNADWIKFEIPHLSCYYYESYCY